MKKYTILTYIFNNYEKLREVENTSNEVEYILVTDDRNLKSSTWNIIYDNNLVGLTPLEKCYRVRYNIFKYANTDICMYLDSNIHILKTPIPLFDKFVDGHYDMSMMPHPLNSTFIPELQNWINMRNYPIDAAKKFLQVLEKTKYDLNYNSLFQGCYKIVRKGKLNSDFERLTYSFMKLLSDFEDDIERVDQTVYSYILNTFFNNIKIMPVSEQILRSEYLTWYWHNSDYKNLNVFYDISKPDIKWMFNKQVECMYLK